MIRRSASLCLAFVALAWGIGSGLTARAAQNGADKIAVWVNGEYITEAEFFERLQRIRAQDFLLSINPLQMRAESAGQIVMASLINERLILQAAAKANVAPTDAEVAAEVEALKKQPSIAQAVSAKIISEDYLKYDIKVQRSRFNLATVAVTLTPMEVEAFYKAHLANYTTPERWKLAAIRTGKPEALAKIQAELKANKPFEEVVKAYSEDEKSKAQGGLLGTIASNDANLPLPLKEAVKKLKIGEITPPIKIDSGNAPNRPQKSVWFFVRLIGKEPEAIHPLSEVKPQVERQALLEKAGGLQVADKKVVQLRAQAEIKVNLPGYQNFAQAKKP